MAPGGDACLQFVSSSGGFMVRLFHLPLFTLQQTNASFPGRWLDAIHAGDDFLPRFRDMNMAYGSSHYAIFCFIYAFPEFRFSRCNDPETGVIVGGIRRKAFTEI